MNTNTGSTPPSFDERLRAARDRQGLGSAAKPEDARNGKPGDWGASPLGVGLRLGLELATALFLAIAIGWGLDRVFHTRPLFLVLFIPLGGAAGVLNIWRIYRPQPDRRAD